MVISSQVNSMTIPGLRHLLHNQEIRNAKITSMNTSIHSANVVSQSRKEMERIVLDLPKEKGTLP